MHEVRRVTWRCGSHTFVFSGRPLIMGILNVTPDSFSDGGAFLDADAAVRHGLAMARDGAAILDVGGESTRPGARPVPAEEEARRVVPVIERLAGECDAAISVDTMKAPVARQALEAGATIINDVSALTQDVDMARVAVDSEAGVILMHMQGTPRTMQEAPAYEDVVKDVAAYFEDRLAAASEAGIDRDRLAVDPGIGFGKTLDHNLDLLRNITKLAESGRPVVVGLSRKSFLGKLTGSTVDQRLAGSIAGLVFCVLEGAHIMRVHDVAMSKDAVDVAMALGEKG